MTRDVGVLVVGAGPTGLGAAYQLQQTDVNWLLVESTSGPGGLAKSARDENGFTWDLGGHVLHSHFTVFDEVIRSSNVQMLSPTRNGWVLIGGQLVPTPIQYQVDAMPKDLRPDAPASNLADYYLNNFGQNLYTSFFKPFTEKMWATPLELVDYEWTSLRNGSSARNVPSIRVRNRAQPVAGSVTFPYPEGGTGRLWDAIAAGLDQDRLLYGVRVDSIDMARRIALLSSGEMVRFDECVTSAPLPALLASSGISQPEVPCSPLVSSQSMLVGFGYVGAPPSALADKSWLYSPDPDVAWHRATMLSNYDAANAGEGRWSVLCEIGRSPFRPISDAEVIRSCRQSLGQLGARNVDLVSIWTRSLPMGYPVPTIGRDDILRQVDAELIQHGVRARGRFGGWRYESCNQDYSFMQGVEAVNAALKDTPEDVYWHPERF